MLIDTIYMLNTCYIYSIYILYAYNEGNMRCIAAVVWPHSGRHSHH